MNIYLKNTLKYIYIRPILGAFNKPISSAHNVGLMNIHLKKHINIYLIWAHIMGL